MAALNQSETEALALAMRTFDNIARDLQRALNGAISFTTNDVASSDDVVMLKKENVETHIRNAQAASKAVHTVKQMKGYYPS
jgi:hypothetical protein